jgi:hypothetical protein
VNRRAVAVVGSDELLSTIPYVINMGIRGSLVVMALLKAGRSRVRDPMR